MRISHLSLPILLLGLAACAPPPPEAFDKLPVGAPTAAIDARRAQHARLEVATLQAPLFAARSDTLRATGTPVSLDVAARRAMGVPGTGDGVPLQVAGRTLEIAQVRYDGMPFLVARSEGDAPGDPSEALKSMVPSVTTCQPSGPVWQEGVGYSVGLSCP